MHRVSLILVISITTIFSLKSQTKMIVEKEVEMGLKVANFESISNQFLTNKASAHRLNAFFMNEEDIQYWSDQFIFTEEVLAQISKDEFYKKLEHWSINSKNNYLNSIKNIDKIELVSTEFDFNDNPNPSMRVNKSAIVTIAAIKNNSVIKTMKLTLIEIKGQLKLIQAL